MRLSFLLLDANVIIYLFEIGLWDKLIDRCDVHVSRTVMGEARYYETGSAQFTIDLQKYESEKRIKVFDVPVSRLAEFFDSFDESYADRLDPGETESLVYAIDAKNEDCLICSADTIVFKVLSLVNRAELGISLEEVLKKTGLGRPVNHQFRKEVRERVGTQGFVDGLQDRGKKKS